jgi:hypothetical protein
MDSIALTETLRALMATYAERLVQEIDQRVETKSVPPLQLGHSWSNLNGFALAYAFYTPEPNPKPHEAIEAIWNIHVMQFSVKFDSQIMWSGGEILHDAVNERLIPRTSEVAVIAKVEELSDYSYQVFKAYFADIQP